MKLCLQDNLINQEEYFNSITNKGNIIIYGIGRKFKQVKELLKKYNIEPIALCDGNQNNWGKDIEVNGKTLKVLSYNKVKELYSSYTILITTYIKNTIEIYSYLTSIGETNSILQFCNPFKVEAGLLEKNILYENIDRYNYIYNNLADDLSRKIFSENLNYKMTGNMLNLCRYTDGNSFFDPKLIPSDKKHVYVDVGTYTGDTICKFLQFCRGDYEKIIGFEPDNGNYAAVNNFIRYGKIENSYIYNIGLWSEKTTKVFYTLQNNENINYDSPNFYSEIEDTIDNNFLENNIKKDNDFISENLIVDTMDNILSGIVPSIMKINALSSDLPILKGAKELIYSHKPIIIIEYATKQEDLLDSIEYLLSVRKDYQIFFRQKSIFGESKTVLYAK